jgi:glucose-6-phosphate 1-epimerase
MSDDGVGRRTIRTGSCTGEVLDRGALALRWNPVGTGPVLFAFSALEVRPGTAPHAGVPVCWPWFGPGRRPGMSPAHGVVRGATWELVDRVEDGAATTHTHRITSATASSPHFPHPYVLELTTRMGADLTITLTTTNTGDVSFDLEEALHAYLHVGDVRRATIRGLAGAEYLDKTTGRVERQRGDLVLTGRTDRVYRSDAAVTVVDPVLGRRLVVTTDGAADRIVWNPWSEDAATLDDVRDEWPAFVCVEGGNVLDDAIAVGPGDSRSMTYRVEVLPL